MQKNIIIARYGEVHLKGANRGTFMRALTNNLENTVGQSCKVALENGRYIFTEFKPEQSDALVHKIAKVFGLTSVSPCTVVAHDKILDFIKTIKIEGTFKCEVNRADKSFPHSSMEFAAITGGVVLDNNPTARVDVHNPDRTVHIDIRENNHAYIYDQIIGAVGGMPVGTAGRGLVLLSGGIDSPVAAYLAAKRGLTVDCIHFASPPYTSDLALEKIRKLRQNLTEYCGNMRVFVVPFTKIQQQIKTHCAPEYMITIMRRFMVRIARNVAVAHEAECIVTGENLSQVASQTIAGITTNNVCAGDIPILRPLITYDKCEIIEIANRIDTYNISIEPHADCCTVFVPHSPIIRPTITRCEREERNLDVERLIADAINGIKEFSVTTCTMYHLYR